MEDDQIKINKLLSVFSEIFWDSINRQLDNGFIDDEYLYELWNFNRSQKTLTSALVNREQEKVRLKLVESVLVLTDFIALNFSVDKNGRRALHPESRHSKREWWEKQRMGLFKLADHVDSLYKKFLKVSVSKTITELKVSKYSAKLPMEIRSDSHIYLKGKSKPILENTTNKAYIFMRGAIELCNEDGTVDTRPLFNYLFENNKLYQLRHRIKPFKDVDEQWKVINDTYHNTKRDYIKDLKNYLIKLQKSQQKLKWKI